MQSGSFDFILANANIFSTGWRRQPEVVVQESSAFTVAVNFKLFSEPMVTVITNNLHLERRALRRRTADDDGNSIL